ncbi:MAG: hypothetical protein QW693_06355 [Candidatus Bathyarchaeia archaeon]
MRSLPVFAEYCEKCGKKLVEKIVIAEVPPSKEVSILSEFPAEVIKGIVPQRNIPYNEILSIDESGIN